MLAHDRKRVLIEDPYHQPEDGDSMEFRLTYEGPLYATQRDPIRTQPDPRTGHKHDIRRVFNLQLRRLWEITPFLKSGKGSFGSPLVPQNFADDPVYDVQSLAAKHSLYGFNFVPLVTSHLNLICGLDILFLRPDKPGGLIWAGDIDNEL